MKIIALVLCFFIASITCQSQAKSHPLIPFNTNFWNYWDHYWTSWLKDHPTYEAIELTTFDNPKSDYKLIRVLLSEKTGIKRQYYYLNDADSVKRSRANAYLRDITYTRKGSPGAPQSLYVKFKDKDDQLIEWTIDFEKDQGMRDHDGGLTPSIHSVGLVQLFHLRTKKVESKTDRVLFDGKDYAFDAADGRSSWYNRDAYSSVIVFGKSAFEIQNDAMSDSWGRIYKRSKDPSQFETGDLSKENFIRFDVDKLDQIRRYRHVSFGHSFTFDFKPALPSSATAKDGQVIQYNVSFDDHENLMTGRILVSRTGSDIVFTWEHATPEWAKSRSFRSIIQLNPAGYSLTTAERTSGP